jgi:RNA polymerase sigma-70 factor (ECF subfamily)
MLMDLTTHASLLARLKRSNAEAAWEEFYRQYSTALLNFGCKLGLSEKDSEDVLQETMVLLMRVLPAFDYGARPGRFRNWLFTIVRNKVREARRRSGRQPSISLDATDGDQQSLIERLEDQNNPAASEEEKLAWKMSLVKEALRSIQRDPQVKPETLAIFQAYVIERQPIETIAHKFGVNPNAIYQIRNRLISRIRSEVGAMSPDATEE